MRVAEVPGGVGPEVWRGRAQAWFAEDLGLRAQQVAAGRSGAIAALLGLGAWHVAGELAAVREEGRLDVLPETERGRWRELWASADALAERALVVARGR